MSTIENLLNTNTELHRNHPVIITKPNVRIKNGKTYKVQVNLYQMSKVSVAQQHYPYLEPESL